MKISGVECAIVWCENTDLYILNILNICIWNVTMKEDVKHFNWTGTLTNERVLQSLIEYVGEKGCLLTVVRQQQKKWLGYNATWQFDA